jgi:predicted dehydrogenase
MTERGGRRVALIGASGIGKHHAKWWHLEGADVCAFAGTTPESVAKAEAGLKALFPFEGRAYTDVEAMLQREKPDIVDVCSPHPCHYEHVRTALLSGCDVFCEKPFVYAPDAPAEELRRQTRDLCALAAEKRRKLGLCVQYSVGARMFLDIWKDRFGDRPVERYRGHLESPAKGRPADPERVWVDLGPHPLSVLWHLARGMVPTEVGTSFQGYEACAQLRMESPAGDALECAIVTRNSLDPPQNVREFAFDDYVFRVEGATDEEGNYCARIDTPDGSHVRPDMMRVRIREFLNGELDDCGEIELNMELMTSVLEAARKAHQPG